MDCQAWHYCGTTDCDEHGKHGSHSEFSPNAELTGEWNGRSGGRIKNGNGGQGLKRRKENRVEGENLLCRKKSGCGLYLYLSQSVYYKTIDSGWELWFLSCSFVFIPTAGTLTFSEIVEVDVEQVNKSVIPYFSRDFDNNGFRIGKSENTAGIAEGGFGS